MLVTLLILRVLIMKLVVTNLFSWTSQRLQTIETTVDMVRRVADQVFIPFTVGGGIRSVEDMNKMLKAGADKVAVNSSALANPQLIADCAQKFGNQCVVAAIDAKKMADGSWHVFVAGGRKDTGRDLIQ